jgi:rubrerythrin
MAEWRCRDCGYKPADKGRPAINTCPSCKGDFTWEEVDD